MNYFLWCMPPAVVLFVAALAVTIGWQFFGKGKHNGVYTLCVTLLVFASFLFARLPLRLGWEEPLSLGVIHSVLDAIKSIGMGADLEAVIKDGVKLLHGLEKVAFDENTTWSLLTDSAHLYAWFVTIQYIVGVGLCAFSVLVTITNWLRQKLFAVRSFAHTFVFSRLTKETVTLAQNIQCAAQKHRKKTAFCFAGADRQTIAALDAELQAAGLKNAVYLPKSLGWKKLPRWAVSFSCILCAGDESANVELLDALLSAQHAEWQNETALQQSKLKSAWTSFTRKLAFACGGLRYRSQCEIKYYIVSESRNTERLVDSLTTTFIHDRKCPGIVTLINPADNLTMQVLSRIPLHEYTTACPSEKESRQLNVLVAGEGAFAQHFVRNAYACGQMADCRFSLTWAATDADRVRSELYAAAPALRNENAEAVKACGELHFHRLDSNAAVADGALVKNMQYVLLAYENDEENIVAARRIRRLIEQEKLADPSRREEATAIVYVVRNPALKRITQTNDAPKIGSGYLACNMIPVGSRDEQYDADSFFYNEMLSKGYFMDYAYYDHNENALTLMKNPEALKESFRDFLCGMRSKKPCNNADKRSSVATALALDYRLSVIRAFRDKEPGNRYRTENEMWEALAEAEHRRWVAYMHMLGFVSPAKEQLDAYFYRDGHSHKNMPLRLHPCLVTAKAGIRSDLWQNPSDLDPLDRLSYDLHTRALDRLFAKYSSFIQPYLDPSSPDTITAGKAAEALAEAEAAPKAERDDVLVGLLRLLYADNKLIDLRMVKQTENILDMVKNPDIVAAISLLWLDM